MYQCVPFLDVCMLFSDGRGFFLALSAAGHAGATPVHHGAKFWPRLGFRGRMLWAFNVEIWQVNHGVAFRGARAEQDNGNPTRHLFCSTAAKALYLWQPRCATAVAHSSLRACAVCTLCYNSFPCL